MADRNDDRFSSPAALRLARELAARSSEKPKSIAPGYVIGTDANGNTILIPTDVQPSAPDGILSRAAREFENYGPRASDFTEGTASAYDAGQRYVQQGRENMQYNPAFGAIQRAGGTIMSALSPVSGAMSAISKPIGRYFGPAAEHAADVALTAAPFAGGRTAKAKPLQTRALEITERPAPEFIGPPEMQGPRQITPQTLIGPPEMQGPQRPFRVNARMKTRPGDPEFIGPTEQIGPQLPRQGSPEFIGPSDFVGPRQPPRPGEPNFVGPVQQIGPQLPRAGDPGFVGPLEQIGPRQPPRAGDPNFIGPVEQIGPRQPTPKDFIGPPEMQGPRQLPRPGDPNFIGPSEFIGPQRPFMAERMSEPVALGTMGAGALTLSRSMKPESRPSNTDVSNFAHLDYVPTSPANTDVSQFSRLDFVPPTAKAAIQTARERAVPLPPARPEEFKARSGGLSSLFSDPYAGKSSRELYLKAQDPSMRDDEYGANLLNIRAARAGRDEGMATGGAATGKSGKMEKDAALHKALDIIAHMLGRH